jgi:hypothetical protein
MSIQELLIRSEQLGAELGRLDAKCTAMRYEFVTSLTELRNMITGKAVRIILGKSFSFVESDVDALEQWPYAFHDEDTVFTVASGFVDGFAVRLIAPGFGCVSKYGDGPIGCHISSIELVGEGA